MFVFLKNVGPIYLFLTALVSKALNILICVSSVFNIEENRIVFYTRLIPAAQLYY